MATNDPVLHALVDLVRAVEIYARPPYNGPAYQDALKVIREHTGMQPEATCRKDAERLDWLSNMDGPFGDFDTFSTADLIASHEYKGKQYSTLRDALDAAMEAFATPQLPEGGS